MASNSEKQRFINQIAVIAIKLCSYRKKWVLPSITIAQACCESAFGTSKAMATANGLFGFKVGKGIKFGSAWKGKSYSTKTKEYYSNYVTITDNFRAYDTVDEAVEDYMDLICSCSRYAGAVNNKDALSTITAIKNGGYATSPTYISTIMNIVKQYDLTKFDMGVAGIVPEKEEYSAGKTYTLQSDLYVRDSADGGKILYQNATKDAQKNALKDKDGSCILKKGTKVTCKGIKKLETSIWMNIPSGWICAKSKEKYYVN